LIVGESGSQAKRWQRAILLVCIAVIALDQASKSVVLDFFANERGRGGVPTTRVVRNTGATLGFGSGHPLVITSLAFAVPAVVAVLTFRTRNRLVSVAGAIVLGGAAGNLADRLFRAPGFGRGAVIDWIHVPGYSPTFNIADFAIRSGAIAAIMIALATGWAQRRIAVSTSVEERL
jgi:signal peptidase II